MAGAVVSTAAAAVATGVAPPDPRTSLVPKGRLFSVALRPVDRQIINILKGMTIILLDFSPHM